MKSIYLLVVLTLLASCSNDKNDQLAFTTAVADYKVIISGEGELEAKNANVIRTPRVWPGPTISFLLPEGSIVKKDDVLVVFSQNQVENEYINQLDELAIATAEAQRIEADLNLQSLLQETQLLSANASAYSAQLQLAKLEFEAPIAREIKKLEIAEYELAADRADKKLKALKKIQIEERARVQLRIKQAKNKVDRAKDQLSKLTLKAPYEGIVVYGINPITQEKVQEGSTLYPGMPVVQLPDMSVMQIKMKIGETDAQKLRTDMPATISIPSLNGLEFSGKVTRVDRVAKPIQRGSKVKKVEVIVQLNDQDNRLRPGITATAEILVRSAMNVLAVAQECLFEKDSVRVVYKQGKRGYEPIPVAVLLQDEDFILVHSDLQGGEKLALKEPPNTRVLWPDSLVSLVAPALVDTFKAAPEKKPEKPQIPPELLKKMKNLPPGAKINAAGK